MSERFRDLVGASLGDDPALSGGGSLERWLAPTSESRVEQVPIEAIDDPHWRPDTADTDPNYRALKSSVRASGILQPLLLRPIGGDRYQLVSGARRLRAARETGQSAVPVIIRELSDVEALLGAWDAVMRAGVSEAERQTLFARLGGSGMAEAEVRALLSGVPARDDGDSAAAPPLATMGSPLPDAPAPPAHTSPPLPAAPAPRAYTPPPDPVAPVVPPAAATPATPAIPAPVGPRPKVISISLPPEALAAASEAPARPAPEVPPPAAPAPTVPASAPPVAPAPAPPAAAARPAVPPWTPAPPAPPAPAPAAYSPSGAPPAPAWSVRPAARPGDPAAPVTPPASSSETPAWSPPASPPVSFLPSGADAAPASTPALDPGPGAAGTATGGVVGRLARDPRTYATVGVFFAVWAVVFIIVAVLIGASNQRLLVAAVVVAAVGFVTAIVGLALGPRRAT
jgi:ParB-like nuclease family protein